MRVTICVETGWSFEYVDNLPIEDIGDILGYLKTKNPEV